MFFLSLCVLGVKGESLENGDTKDGNFIEEDNLFHKKWGLRQVLILMLMFIVLVKIKKWLVKMYLLRTFDIKARKFLSLFRS